MTKLNKTYKNQLLFIRLSLFLTLASGCFIFFGCNSHKSKINADKNNVKLSKEVEKLVEEIKQDNYMGTPYIARGTVIDSAFIRKEKLQNLATEEELYQLAINPHPIIRLTAFQGLYDRYPEFAQSVFENYKKQSETITFIKGDIVLNMSGLEYAYVYILNYEILNEEGNYDNENTIRKIELSQEEQNQITHLILKLRMEE